MQHFDSTGMVCDTLDNVKDVFKEINECQSI